MSLINSADALRALHRVLVCARFEAYDNCDSKTLGDVMDVAEYLVALLQNHEGLTEAAALSEFRAYLQELENRFPGYNGLVSAFDNAPQAERVASLTAIAA